MSVHVLEFKYEITPSGKTRDMVHYAGAGDASYASTWAYVSDFQPRGSRPVGEQAAIVWSFIEPAYKAWKEGMEIPENGTALAAWAGIPAEVIKAFQRAGLKTVEDVATMNDTVMGRVHVPGVRAYRTQAQTLLDGRETAELAAQITARDGEMEVMREEMEAMRKEMAAFQAAKQPEAKRRGRPPKQDEAA